MSDEKAQSGTYTSPNQIGVTPAAVVKRWLLELNLAEKAQKDWMRTGDKIVERYRGTKQKKNSFNILWSNTETLRQAVYNTLPKPDVRRRFRDVDPVAKVVSDVLERCADYAMDVYDFDHVLKLDLMDMLLPGRGISRVKYVPDLEDMELDASQETKSDDEATEQAEAAQRIAYERVMCEHVNWEDFRHGPGKTWDEVRWVAFRHRMSRFTLVEKFGDIGELVNLDNAADEEVKKMDQAIGDLFKTADVWEIWNKDDKEVLFIAPSFKQEPLFPTDNPTGADPLGLEGFFPIPRPLYAIEDANTLLPTPLFELYKQQADELDRVSARINNLTDALKVRGIYNSVLTEIGRLQELSDNQFEPAENVMALIESGGLEKHIWMMPIEKAAAVIKILIEQRETCKGVIYELTGIADIMRGATDSQETYGAQKIKTQWGTQRLKKMQAEFQRYVRDIIRLKCQIIANKFQLQTIADMTGLKLINTEAEKQQIQQQAARFQQYQQMQQQAQQQASPGGPPQAPIPQQPGLAPGFFSPPQPPSPEQMALLAKPSWEQVIGLMKDNVHRSYRIDIETDSTIAASLDADMAGLSQVMQAVSGFMKEIEPLVMSGMLPIDAAKEILMTITRRARMGMSVEDALDKMQPPKPQQDPKIGIEQQKLQAAQQLEQFRAQQDERAKQMDLALDQQRMQMEARFEEQRAQNEMRIAQAEQAYQAQQDSQAQQMEHEREMQRQANERQMEQMRQAMEERTRQMEAQVQLLLADKNNVTKIEVAEVTAQATLDAAQISAAKQAQGGE